MKRFLRTTLKSISEEILKDQVKHNSKKILATDKKQCTRSNAATARPFTLVRWTVLHSGCQNNDDDDDHNNRVRN